MPRTPRGADRAGEPARFGGRMKNIAWALQAVLSYSSTSSPVGRSTCTSSGRNGQCTKVCLSHPALSSAGRARWSGDGEGMLPGSPADHIASVAHSTLAAAARTRRWRALSSLQRRGVPGRRAVWLFCAAGGTPVGSPRRSCSACPADAERSICRRLTFRSVRTITSIRVVPTWGSPRTSFRAGTGACGPSRYRPTSRDPISA